MLTLPTWVANKIITGKTRDSRIAYIDLFAGPGRYKDGTVSTPLLILEQAIKDPAMQKMLVTMFNDANADNTKSLEASDQQPPGHRGAQARAEGSQQRGRQGDRREVREDEPRPDPDVR